MKSIRGLFFTYFFLSLIVVFGSLSAFLYFSTTRFLERNIIRDHSRVLDGLATNLTSQYLGRLKSVEFLAQEIEQHNGDLNRSRQLIKTFLSLDTLVGSVHLYDGRGDLLVAEKKDEIPPYKLIQKFENMSEFFQQQATALFNTGKTQISPYFITHYNRILQVYMVPLWKKGNPRPVGIVSGAVFPTENDLKYTVDGFSLGTNNIFVISDRNGHILTSTEFKDPHERQVIYDYFKDFPKTHPNAEFGTHSASHLKDFSHLPYFLLARADPQSEVVFFLFVSQKNLEDKKKEMISSSFTAYLVSLLLVVFISGFLSNKISRPMTRIYRTLRAYRKGEFNSRTKVKSEDFLGQVAEEVDRLGENIEKDRFIATLWSGKWDQQ